MSSAPTPTIPPTEKSREVDQIIARNEFRSSVYNLIAPGSRRILDFGCNQGELLLRLRRDKECSELYGIDIKEKVRPLVERHLDGSWILDLSKSEAELGSKYHGYFHYIVMHDVIEHLYDPWYVVAKLRKYLHPEGALYIVTPNFMYWGLLYLTLRGRFHYGSGGLMNEEHIRWFTSDSLTELAEMCGLRAETTWFLYPEEVNTDLLSENLKKPITCLELPPREFGLPKQCEIKFPGDIRKKYSEYLANKIFMMCRKTKEEVIARRTAVGTLAKRREEMQHPGS